HARAFASGSRRRSDRRGNRRRTVDHALRPRFRGRYGGLRTRSQEVPERAAEARPVTARRRAEPRWLTRRMLDVLHEAQLREHGGSPGVRDHGLLAAALPRPRQKFVYARGPDLATRAAAYAFGLTK